MSSLASLRGDVRRDLHDEDSAAYRWADAEIDRHIKRALREYSLVNPLEQKTGLTTTIDPLSIAKSTTATTMGRSSLVSRRREPAPFPPRPGFATWD